MARIDDYEDPDVPQATRIVPATSTIVLNEAGEILLQQRRDNNLWAFAHTAFSRA